MIDVASVRLLAERLAKIAADCFDRRAAQHLREIADELLDSNRKASEERTGASDSGGATPA